MPPPAVAVIGAVATVASTAVGVISVLQQGAARQAQYQGAADVSSYNAAVARNQAEAIRRQGELSAQIQRERTRRLLSTQMARYGAAGVDIEGSPLLVMAESVFQGARDEATIRANANYNAGLAEANAAIYGMKAGQYAQAADMAGEGTTVGVLTAGIGGLATANRFGLFKIPTWGSKDTGDKYGPERYGSEGE